MRRAATCTDTFSAPKARTSDPVQPTPQPQTKPEGMKMEDDMKLPEGKTCGDCTHFGRCKWLFNCKPANKTCDWAPSRFQPKPKASARVVEPQEAGRVS